MVLARSRQFQLVLDGFRSFQPVLDRFSSFQVVLARCSSFLTLVKYPDQRTLRDHITIFYFYFSEINPDNKGLLTSWKFILDSVSSPKCFIFSFSIMIIVLKICCLKSNHFDLNVSKKLCLLFFPFFVLVIPSLNLLICSSSYSASAKSVASF